MGRRTHRELVRTLRVSVGTGLLLAAAGCGDDPTTPPPPDTPPSLALAATGRHAAILVGETAPADSVALAITGDGAEEVAWAVAAGSARTLLASSTGRGSGMIRWTRQAGGLSEGMYIDTIRVTVPTRSEVVLRLIDTLQITTTPIPLTLALADSGRHTAVTVGTVHVDDSVAVVIQGTGAAAATWQASARRASTALTTAEGVGSGLVRWRRTTADLPAGRYIDTITVSAPSITGGVVRFHDTLDVRVPLVLQLGSTGRRTTMAANAAPVEAEVAVSVSDPDAPHGAWTATNRAAWNQLLTVLGAGSGMLRWTRNPAELAPGTYVDTLTVTIPGAIGSPARFLDTLAVTAATPPTTGRPNLGHNASMNGWRPFPDNDPWNTPVDQAEVDPNSLAILTNVGLDKRLHPDFGASWNGGPFGIPYVVVPDDTPKFPVLFEYAGESDVGPYPIPANPPIEGNGEGDAHILMITRDERKLYELFYAHYRDGRWTAGSGAIFDLIRNTQRPAGWTSADAAGLPIFPGLVRYDEVYEQGEIRHALRFTVTRTRRAYVPPATHWASSSTDPTRPPMGMRVRLKASVDISAYPEKAQVILRALKKYGMMVADNGGDFFLSGAPDARWDDEVNNTLKQIRVRDFEVIRMVGVVGP